MIEKIIFRDQVRELLLKKMRDGSLLPEDSVSLALLARELDVSVTPIREALTQLQFSGILEAVPNKGFRIPELSIDEARCLYELVSSLETLAIKNSIYTDKTIEKLKNQNEIFKASTKKIERVNSDIAFHEILTSNYKNPIALRILSDLKTRIIFYELEFMSNNENHQESDDEHQRIISYLINDQKENAAKVVEKNWLKILEFWQTYF